MKKAESYSAQHWTELQPDGRWHITADAAHKRVNPVLYRCDEVISTWAKIQAPVLWVEGKRTEHDRGGGDKYPRSELEDRLSKVRSVERRVINQAGHMIHLDQPEALAAAIEDFLSR
ncbi:alpha/beta fold hydrolase [Eoetvoesiella caeni]